HVYADGFRERTTVVTGEGAPADRAALLADQGVTVLRLPDEPDAAMVAQFRAHCVDAGITGVLFEGGNRLISAFLGAGALDYILAYRAPVLLADDAALPAFSGAAPDWIGEGWRLDEVRHATFGPDQLMRGRLVPGAGAVEEA